MKETKKNHNQEYTISSLIKMLENADDEGLSNILDQVTPETAQPEETAEPVSYTHLDVYKRQTLERLPGITRRKVGMTSNPHAPYDQGYTRATMA